MKKAPFLTVKDYSISGEEFQLIYVDELDMLETSPQPEHQKLQEYYKSEDYISHTDGKRNLFERAYQFVKARALTQKLKLISSFELENKNLLDIGCGTGDFIEKAKANYWEVTGIEPNEKARVIANSKTHDAVFNNDKLNVLSKESFDVITLWHVLEHLPDLDEYIGILNKLLKPGGRIVIAIPNFKSFDASYYKNYWAAYDVPRHLWHFSRKSIQCLFEKENMIVDKILPMKYDAYYVSLLSEKFKSGWMNIFNAFFVATRSNLKATRTGEYSSLIYIIKKN